MKMIAPNIAKPTMKPIAVARRKTDERNSAQRQDRLGGPALLPDEQRQQHDAARPRGR